MSDKEDLRVVRTRKLLSNTLLDMMEKEPIEKISVKDLCDNAMVNRATFYSHFEDKYHLLNIALGELQDDLYANFMGVKNCATPSETVRAIMVMAVDFFHNNENHIINILRYNKGGKVMRTIQDSLAQSIKYQLNKFSAEYDFLIPLSIIAHYISGGMMNLAMYCVDHTGKYSEEDFLEFLSFYNLNAFCTKKA